MTDSDEERPRCRRLMWHVGPCGEPIDAQEAEDRILYGSCDLEVPAAVEAR